MAQDSSLPAHPPIALLVPRGGPTQKRGRDAVNTVEDLPRVVLTNLRSSGGARRAPPLSARALTAAEGFELGEQLKTSLVIPGAVPFHTGPCLLPVLRFFPG